MALAPEPRLPLSRDRILRAALELVDEHGIDALSMRRLGGALAFEAMSLYNHVTNKDDVVNGIIDLVLAETELPAKDEEWDTSIRSSAISVHEALGRHPWACTLLMSPGRIRPARLRYMDALLGRLREAGFSADTTYVAYHVLDAHIFGFSLWHASHTYSPVQVADMVEFFERTITVEAYPYLREHAEQHFADGPHREVDAFAFGIDLIIDGLRKIHDAA